MKKKIELIMAVCLVIAAFFLGSQSAILVQNSHIDTKGTPDTDSAHNTELTGDTGQTSSPSGNLSIVIDAGHGGIDPGKVGTNDALEKDINLALALKLRDKFKQDSIRIILTRDSDIGLYSEGNTNKKAEDMQNRCKIITEAAPIFTVSLHQNSYPSPEVCGAQVFYFGQIIAFICFCNAVIIRINICDQAVLDRICQFFSILRLTKIKYLCTADFRRRIAVLVQADRKDGGCLRDDFTSILHWH